MSYLKKYGLLSFLGFVTLTSLGPSTSAEQTPSIRSVNPQAGENIWHLSAKLGTVIDVIETKLDILEGNVQEDFASAFDQLDNITSKALIITSTLLLANTELDSLSNDLLFHVVDTFTSLDAIASKLLLTVTTAQATGQTAEQELITFNSMLEEVTSKVCFVELRLDSLYNQASLSFDSTWTSLAQYEQEGTLVSSCLEELNNELTQDFAQTWTIFDPLACANQPSASDDFHATWTMLDAQTGKLENSNQLVQELYNTSLENFNQTFTILNSVSCALSSASAAFQQTWTMLDGIERTQESFLDLISVRLSTITADIIPSTTTLAALDACKSIGITISETITSSGIYCLSNDITGGLIINASDVFLDLNNHIIDSGDTGIQISGNNIFIQNGCIQNMINYGVNACGNNIVISDCEFIQNGTGCQLTYASNSLITNCQALDNIYAAFALHASSYSTVSNCKALSTTSPINAFGFISTNGLMNTFKACISNNIATTSGNSIYTPVGFMFQAGETASNLLNLTAENIYSTSPSHLASFGIYVPALSATLNEVTTFTHGATLNTVSWLTSDTMVYLALAGVDDTLAFDTRVCAFDPFTETLSLIASFDANLTDVNALAWLTAGKRIFLAAGGISSPQITLLEFDKSANSLSSISTATFSHGDTINAVDWFTTSTHDYFLAIAGKTGTASNQVQILQFTPSTQALDALSSGTFAHTATVHAAQWLSYKDNAYLAIAGDADGPLVQVRILKYNFTKQTLDLFGTANFSNGGSTSLYALDWLVIAGQKFLAVGGAVDGAPSNVRILLFNDSAGTLTQAGSAFINLNNATVSSVKWFSIGTVPYLAVGTSDGSGSNNVYILSFNPTALTLSLAGSAAFDHGASATINSVDWIDKANAKTLAICGIAGTNSKEARLLEFKPTSTQCFIQNNVVNSVQGKGLQVDSTQNVVISNIAYGNTTNYASSILNTHISNSGIGGTPGRLLNISLSL